MTPLPTHGPGEHSEIGASGTYRWWNCPASVTRSRGMPNITTEAAALGTSRHTLGELCLRSGQDAIEYVGRVVDKHEVDEKAAEDVQLYLDTVRGWPDDGEPLQVEVRFNLASLNPPGPMFGTSDAARYYPSTGTLRIADYKNGWVPVEINDNPQIKYYALGAAVALGTDKPVRRIEGTIVQPNRGGVKTAEFDPLDLAEWSIELMARASAALDPAAPAAAGSWCRFCAVAGTCRERAESNLAAAAVQLPALPAEGGPPPPSSLTDAEISTILSRAPEFTAWLDAVKAAAMARGGVPGWKLVATQGRTVWRDPAEAAPILEHILEVPDIFDLPKLRSYASIRDSLAAAVYAAAKAAGTKLTKKAAEAEARKALAHLVVPGPTGVTLAPDSDPRPAIAAGGAEFSILAAEGTPE